MGHCYNEFLVLVQIYQMVGWSEVINYTAMNNPG